MKPLYVKKNGVVYRVSGTGIPSIYPAANVEYDNTVTSELQATDVQGAIDELSTRQGGVQSDWNEDDTTELDYIKNKPQNLVQDASYVHTDNNYDATAKGKVDALGTASTKDAGVANGVAELDAAGKVPSSQLPSFVDDVIEVADYDHLPITGESGKIYVTLDTNKTYRWTGSGYAEISESLALGETSSTAYRGDRGKTAYDHATESGKISSAVTSGLYKVAATAEGHIAGLTAVEKSDITGLGIPGSDTNTTYTFAGGTNKITVTPSGGTAQDVVITPNDSTKVSKSGDTMSGALTLGTSGSVENGDSKAITGGTVYNQALRFKDLSSRQDYTRIVIGLCEISASASQGSANCFSGRVMAIRSNALYNTKIADITIQDSYSVAKSCAYSLMSNFENTSTAAITGDGYRVCTFTYNSKNYAGLEFHIASSCSIYVMGNWTPAFTPFKVIYYTQSSSPTINNEEIYNSINFSATNNIRYGLTVDKAKDSNTINGLTVETAVPSGAKFTDTTYNFYGATFNSGNQSTAEHNANNIQVNGEYYYNSNGPATTKGATTNDGGLYAQFHSTTWGGQIAQDYRNGNLFVRGKNNGTLTEWSPIASGLKIAWGRYGTTGSTTKIKINIKPATSWMLCFVVTLYQGYRATKVMISGYNYSSNHWYQPSAKLLADSSNATINVYFGYDSNYNLWIGFDGASYTGVCISDVCNGFTQLADLGEMFTISNVSSLDTLQTTISAGKPDAATVNGYTVEKSVPSNAVFTDTNNAVTQTATTTDANYEVLFSVTADNTTRTEGARKSNTLRFNPSKGSLMEGNATTASGSYSHAEGQQTSASGSSAHAEGGSTTASGNYSHAEGMYTIASQQEAHAEGYSTCATNSNSHSSGHYNAAMTTGGTYYNTTGTAFVIGNGTAQNARSNAFSVQFNGVVKAASTITASTTADYAEYFEWADENPSNEDRIGYFVTFDNGDKIRFATSEDDYILGVTSGEPFVLGNGDCDVWNGMVLRDEFRRVIYEPAPEMIDVAGGRIPHLDKDGNPVYNGTRPKLNPNYDPSKPYVNRADRPEWCPVGMLGVLAVRDDGTCEVNGYATITDNAIATKYTGQNQNKYRVIKRNTENVVEIVFR